jgi:hypothetical protein
MSYQDDQPRDENGRWTNGGDSAKRGGKNYTGPKRSMAKQLEETKRFLKEWKASKSERQRATKLQARGASAKTIRAVLRDARQAKADNAMTKRYNRNARARQRYAENQVAPPGPWAGGGYY